MGEIFESLESERVWSPDSLKLQFSVSIILLKASQGVTVSGLFQPKWKINRKLFKMDIGLVSISFSLKDSLRGEVCWKLSKSYLLCNVEYNSSQCLSHSVA